MEAERTANIQIGGDEYTLLLTTKATKEIAGRYGGLENLGDKLMKSENFEMAIGKIVWLITLLANQSILVHNLKNNEDISLTISLRTESDTLTLYLRRKCRNFIMNFLRCY